MTDQTSDLEALLAGEHAASYGYGTAGAVLTRLAAPGDVMSAVRANFDAHRIARDQLADVIAAAGGQPPAPQAAYQLPFALQDVAAALRLLIGVEDRLCKLAAAAVSGQPGRSLAARVLSAAAARAAQLRLLAGTSAASAAVAFPGLPGRG